MKIAGLTKNYGEKRVLDGIDLELFDGEILCVLGASGSGKTTLLNCVAGLTAYEGEIVGAPDRVAYVFQEDRLLPALTVRQNLLFAGGRVALIDEMLAEVGLLEHADKRPSALSGGEKRRVALVRAFLSNSPLLLMDEPFTGLDTALKIRLIELFVQLWKKEKKTVLFVTHDLNETVAVAERAVVLKNGKIALEIPFLKRGLPSFGFEGAEKEALLTAILDDGTQPKTETTSEAGEGEGAV
ncbi:MAG: ABC transporter ATP-binding protein [Clostridia bacterium]|nr:ABC transporter ATP-binding protein [Clostridia bacterium]